MIAVDRYSQGSAMRGNRSQMQRMLEPAFDSRQHPDVLGGRRPRRKLSTRKIPSTRTPRQAAACHLSLQRLYGIRYPCLLDNLIDLRAMTVIREADVITSVADALQYISYYHTPDFIRAMGRAYEVEQSPAARDAIAQILHQFAHVRRRAPADMSGHRHRGGVRQGGHGRDLGRNARSSGDDQ